MPRRRFLFDQPDRFVVGTVGVPGNRTFFLQARLGTRTVSVSIEKVQVVVLAQRLGELLDQLAERIVQGAEEVPGAVGDTGALDEPLNEVFRAGTLSLGWDSADELVLFEARELTEDDITDDDDDESDFADDDEEDEEPADDDEDGPDMFRVRFEPAAARLFVARALRVLAAGRPPCPLCGQPLDPQGHLCPRRNGHLLH